MRAALLTLKEYPVRGRRVAVLGDMFELGAITPVSYTHLDVYKRQEQIRNSIAYVNANVKFGFSHSGLCVGEDGGSHQRIEDIALMRVIDVYKRQARPFPQQAVRCAC